MLQLKVTLLEHHDQLICMAEQPGCVMALLEALMKVANWMKQDMNVSGFRSTDQEQWPDALLHCRLDCYPLSLLTKIISAWLHLCF